MPTKKKTPARKKASKPSVKRTVKKVTAKKPKAKAAKKASRPVGPREQALASSALKLVDEAAALLRRGIKTSADTTEKSRLEAKKRAHNLLTKATSSLGGIFGSGADALHKAISKL